MAFSVAWLEHAVQDAAAERGLLAGFRGELYRCFSRRAYALLEGSRRIHGRCARAAGTVCEDGHHICGSASPRVSDSTAIKIVVMAKLFELVLFMRLLLQISV